MRRKTKFIRPRGGWAGEYALRDLTLVGIPVGFLLMARRASETDEVFTHGMTRAKPLSLPDSAHA